VTLPIHPPFPPMEARSVPALPLEGEWQYEPKWDGFRCLAFRDGESIELQSKAGEPLQRYFPEVVEHLRALAASRFVLDGELVVPEGDSVSFDALLQRIHPAESRIRKLAQETPALFIVFDLLVDASGRSWVGQPLVDRRRELEAFAARELAGRAGVALSPATREPGVAARWLDASAGALDGVIAKDAGMPYRSGDRTGMQKFKPRRTADCVVGGYREAAAGGSVGSLLLGLYDEAGTLHHVGFTSSLAAPDRKRLLPELEKLPKSPGFTGRAPGGPSRWSRGRSAEWHPLDPRLVAEVEYDHVTGERFRHGTRFLRWRPDKAPRQCTLDQIESGEGAPLDLLRSPRKTPGSSRGRSGRKLAGAATSRPRPSSRRKRRSST